MLITTGAPVSMPPPVPPHHSVLCKTGPDHDPSGVTKGHYWIAMIAICYTPMIIIGSVLIILATFTYKKLSTPYNYMIFSLALSDFLIGTFCIPIFATSFLQPFLIRDSEFLCLFCFMSYQFAKGASLCSVFLLSIERAIAVFKPPKFVNLMSKRNSKLFILIAWVGSFTLSALPFLGLYNYDPSKPCLLERCNYYETLSDEYIWVSRGVNGSLVTMSIVLNVASYWRANKLLRLVNEISIKQREEAELTGSSQGNSYDIFLTTESSPQGSPYFTYKQISESLKTVRLSYFLLFVYMMFSLPTLLVMPLKYLMKGSVAIEYYKQVCELLSFTIAVFNPTIVTYVRREYWEAFRNLVTTNPCRWYSLRRLSLLRSGSIPELRDVMTGWSNLSKTRGKKLSEKAKRMLRLRRLRRKFPELEINDLYEMAAGSPTFSTNKATFNDTTTPTVTYMGHSGPGHSKSLPNIHM